MLPKKNSVNGLKKEYLENNYYLHVMEDPKRVSNCDETAFFLSPKEDKVLVKKGQKTVYNFINNDEKECLTTLVMSNACGDLPPPMLVSSYKRIPQKVVEEVLPAWGVGRTDSGWMTIEEIQLDELLPENHNDGSVTPESQHVDENSSLTILERPPEKSIPDKNTGNTVGEKIPTPFRKLLFWPIRTSNEKVDGAKRKIKENIPTVVSVPSNKSAESRLQSTDVEDSTEDSAENKEKIEVDTYVIVKYEEMFFSSKILQIGNVNGIMEYDASSMEKHGINWKWPSRPDIIWYTEDEIQQRIKEP
ncbi:hypothetical protein JTB14_001802 [Gonioctena quinquepunctata]|nr:hypothetical protein JTB14_001802 [Gonioctena quinquepunctata]